MKVNIALDSRAFCSVFYEVLCSECFAGKAHNTEQRFIHLFNVLIPINLNANQLMRLFSVFYI